MTTVMFYEAAIVHQHHVKEFKNLLSEHIQNLVTQGQAITTIEYANAKNAQSQLRQSVVPYLSQYDALLTIPANGEAPLGLISTGDPMFCSLWSFLGLPAITMPIAKSRNNLPLGLQLVGKMAQDQRLLQTAKTVQTICLFDLYQS
jgi:Asp-tRNA(Asn)/Glu-tRNA(Gln) amidotransferase A subunit family amidase